MPKPKPNRRAQLSRVKKHELEKQTLLIMDQMISHVKDFTTKERYFDYKKISSNIQTYNISPADCKKIWEQFKSRLRGQFKEGNEEMRQCRNECNEDFWTHHYRSYQMRLNVYNKMAGHPEILRDLEKLTYILNGQDKAHLHNELLEMRDNEEKLLPVLDEFDRAIKTSDDHEELDQLDALVQNLGKELETANQIAKGSNKQKSQTKEETEIFNKIMSRIYTELTIEYDKKVYNPPQSAKVEDEEKSEPVKKDVAKLPGCSKSNTESSDTVKTEPKVAENLNREWTPLEILSLLRGIYQYGETKWAEIFAAYEFKNKTPHDLSVKWMDIRFQMLKDLKRLNKKHQNSVKRLSWLVATIKNLRDY